jgi:uncharacterized protein (TIGR03083 family)
MIDLGVEYGESRRRLTELVRDLPDPAATDVACCPGWSVHDVIAHLVAVIEDVNAGQLAGPPDDAWTAGQIARRAGRPTGDVLAEWAGMSPPFEQLLSGTPVWPALMDVVSHEHDVRAALGDGGARDTEVISACGVRLVKALRDDPEMAALKVSVDGEDVLSGDGRGAVHLRTTPWEAFRFRLGRRSRQQIQGMDWTGDPTAILGRLTIFGPSPEDIRE